MKWFKTVPFSDIVLWDVKRYSFEKINSQYPVEKLGMHIQEESHKVKLADFPDEEFGILGVNNKIGIFDAYKEKGANFNQSYKKMEKDWLAYNPYRVNVGSIGLRNEGHENEYISPAYVVFSCKETLLPDFLFKLFKTKRFNKVINASTTGSVRQNLTIDILKSLDIPLPPIEVQRKILELYDFESYQSKEFAKESNRVGSEIDEFLLKELGINLTIKERKSGLSYTQFSTIDRWSVDYLFNLSSVDGLQKAKYPLHPIGRYIIEAQYGLSSKASTEPIGTPMLRMNNIHNSELDISDLKYISLTKNEKKKYLLEKGDLLFNRTNSKELVGKTAVFKEDDEFTFASYLIRLKLNTLKLDVDYINFLFNSPIGRVQIDLISRQVLGQANVNAQELREFVFPIPVIEIQNAIAKNALKMKEKQNHLLLLAEEQKINAISNVEKAVFSE